MPLEPAQIISGRRAASPAPRSRSRSCSFNVWGGGANEGRPVDETVAAIVAAGADIVGMQETRLESDPCTAESCPAVGPSVAGEIAERLAFITTTRRRATPRSGRTPCSADIRSSARRATISVSRSMCSAAVCLRCRAPAGSETPRPMVERTGADAFLVRRSTGRYKPPIEHTKLALGARSQRSVMSPRRCFHSPSASTQLSVAAAFGRRLRAPLERLFGHDLVPSARAQRSAPPGSGRRRIPLPGARASTGLEGTGRRARSARRTRGGPPLLRWRYRVVDGAAEAAMQADAIER